MLLRAGYVISVDGPVSFLNMLYKKVKEYGRTDCKVRPTPEYIYLCGLNAPPKRISSKPAKTARPRKLQARESCMQGFI